MAAGAVAAVGTASGSGDLSRTEQVGSTSRTWCTSVAVTVVVKFSFHCSGSGLAWLSSWSKLPGKQRASHIAAGVFVFSSSCISFVMGIGWHWHLQCQSGIFCSFERSWLGTLTAMFVQARFWEFVEDELNQLHTMHMQLAGVR